MAKTKKKFIDTSEWSKSDVGLNNVTNDAQLKIASNLSDVNNAASAFGNIKQAASESATGVVELATIAEIEAGSDAGKAMCPDQFAGSKFGKRILACKIFDDVTALATGAGKFIIPIPPELSGMNLVGVFTSVSTVSSSGAITVALRRIRTGTGSGTNDMLSTNITIDANEKSTSTAVTAAVINTSYDDVTQTSATQDEIAIDVDGAGTGAKGLMVLLSFQLP